MIMDFNDFPCYFQAASKAALKYQHYYNSIRRSAVIALILAIVVTIYSIQQPQYSAMVNTVVAVLVCLSFVLALVLLTKKYDQIAQEAHSLKVACESLSWQFIMGARGFDSYLDSNALKLDFENRLQQILEEFKEVLPHLDTTILSREVVTTKMMELKMASFQDKKSYYVEKRVQLVADSYFEKSIEHHRKYNLWGLNLIMSHLLAIVALGYLVFDISTDWSLIALVTMLVSSALSWRELQLNGANKQRYTLALSEIILIQKAIENQILESELSTFVWEAEKLISGPNALWLAAEPMKKVTQEGLEV